MKLKTYKFLLIILSLSATSCTLHFDRYYNNAVSEFPKEYWGKYIYVEKKDSGQDTIIMYISKDSVNYDKNFFLAGGKLGKEVILAKGKKHYLLCQGDTVSGKMIWDIYPIKLSDNKLRVYVIDADYYGKYFKKHFTAIEGTDNLYKMDEAAFDKFCKSKLKKKKSVKFIKTE